MQYLSLHTQHRISPMVSALLKRFGQPGYATWVLLMTLWSQDSAELVVRQDENGQKVRGVLAKYHLTVIAQYCGCRPSKALKVIQWLDDWGHLMWINRPQFESLIRETVGKQTGTGRELHGIWTGIEREPDGNITIFWPKLFIHNKPYYESYISRSFLSNKEPVSQPKTESKNVDNSNLKEQSEMILTLVNLSRTLFPNPLSSGQAGVLLKSVDSNYTVAEEKVQEAKSARNPIAWLMAFAHRPERKVET